MKFLYAIQGTGNGHISRSRVLLPELKKYGGVDVLISGQQCDLALSHPIKYQCYGAGFFFGKKGGVDLGKTLSKARPITLIKDILSLPVQEYDMVFSDFEPISAWACRLRGVPCIGVSHQASFLSPKTPRPPRKNTIAEWILKNYAPTSHHQGFHFDQYDAGVTTPIISDHIRKAPIGDQGHFLVYLPSYDADFLVNYFSLFDKYQWCIYTKKDNCPSRNKRNVKVVTCGAQSWFEDLTQCTGAIVGAGFETPAELLYLGKKMMVIPMAHQYEQQCNAAALAKMDVPVLHTLDASARSLIHRWIAAPKPKRTFFPEVTHEVIYQLVSKRLSEKSMAYTPSCAS